MLLRAISEPVACRRRLGRRAALGTGANGALALAFATCFDDPGAATTDTDSGTFEFVHCGGINQHKGFADHFEQFSTGHPEIDFRAPSVSGTWPQVAHAEAARIAGGRPPDIVQTATEGHRLFMDKDVLVPAPVALVLALALESSHAVRGIEGDTP
ncbi:hypothetical protein [Brachybacterium kimchii]|uniref:Uncharacterized protein n=1 Tax=Brachybacterium kimchii TaxID=2942909 RepID=A0ABY4N2Y3_9MICO|nr:hypothetical protein [Brachybacterium kimchii]UQN28926.1 hypothetical protein M4486_15020 [Brachybacterium kimchii]